jgi:hypothetical protein
MSKHTQGPWKYRLNNSAVAFRVTDVRERLVTSISWNSVSDEHFPPRDEAEANAHLIAAAPELLEALETLVRNKRLIMTEENFAKNPGLQAAVAAIAKATGEA